MAHLYTEHFDDVRQRPYYVSKVTGVSVWTIPEQQPEERGLRPARTPVTAATAIQAGWRYGGEPTYFYLLVLLICTSPGASKH